MAGLSGVDYVGYGVYTIPNSIGDYRGPQDFKPGLIFPEKKKDNKAAKVAVTVAGLAGTAILAYVFRGKIKDAGKAAYETVKPYAKVALDKCKDYAGKVKDFAKPYLEKVGNFFKNLMPKKAAAPTS